MRLRGIPVLLLLLTLLPSLSRAADTPGADERLKALESKLTDLEFQLDQVRKSNLKVFISATNVEVDPTTSTVKRMGWCV